MASAAIFVCNRERGANEGVERESGATFVLNRLLGKTVLLKFISKFKGASLIAVNISSEI